MTHEEVMGMLIVFTGLVLFLPLLGVAVAIAMKVAEVVYDYLNKAF